MLGTKILEERESKYNGSLKVTKSLGFGTYIQAGGLTQSGGIVETIWKSTIKKVKSDKQSLPFDGKLMVKSCLVIGLGGGTVVKLVKKNWPEVEIMGIDIDPIIVELGEKYLGLGQVDVEIKIGDALELVKRLKMKGERFDLIVVDLYNGDKYPEKFETENYIQLVKTVLSNSGTAIFNRLYYGDKRPQAVKFGNKLKKIFSKVEWFYPEANLMLICH
jgi:spermidine synthase